MLEKKPWNGVEIPEDLSARGILYLGGLGSTLCVCSSGMSVWDGGFKE